MIVVQGCFLHKKHKAVMLNASLNTIMSREKKSSGLIFEPNLTKTQYEK